MTALPATAAAATLREAAQPAVGSPGLCYIVSDWLQEPYGTEALAVMVAEGLHALGWRIRAFTLGYNARTSVWAPRLRAAGADVVSLRLPFLRRAHLPQRLLARRVWRFAARERPDLVFCPTNDPLVIRTIMARPDRGAPVFVHDPNEAGAKYPHYDRRWTDGSLTIAGLSVHGETQRAAALGLHGARWPIDVVWPASLPPERTPPPPATGLPLRFGQLGRLHPQKGGEFMLAAFAQLLAGGTQAELHFFGDGPDRERLGAFAASMGIAAAVRFHGRYSWRDLDDIAASIDVAVMPSIYEGFGLVMLEMMSRGRPVISSDVGSSREVLEELGGGWVVPRADTAALFRVLRQCCDEPRGVRAQGRRAEEVWRTHFTPAAMTARYLRFWERSSPGTVCRSPRA